MSESPETWTTYYECQFLDGLGTHQCYQKPGNIIKRDRAALLRGYLRGLKKRGVWHGDGLNLNRVEIKNYAENLLRGAEK